MLMFSAACSDAEGTVTIVTGEETDVFAGAPAGDARHRAGGARRHAKEVGRQTLPVDGVDPRRELQQSDIGAIAITGLGADGKALVKGQSLLVQWAPSATRRCSSSPSAPASSHAC